MPAITFDQVSKVFGRDVRGALAARGSAEWRGPKQGRVGAFVAVHDVSLQIIRGEIFVLMGLSGSGKSTLLRCINALVPINAGTIWVRHNGAPVDVHRCGSAVLRELRQQTVSMVFQKFALLPWRSLVDNVAFGLELRRGRGVDVRRVAAEKLELVGLGAWGDKFPHELSGGMQQRVGLARALATDADILLLDEPFSALDPLTRTRLQDELLRLQKQLNKTLVFVTHDLAEALRLGSRIAIMEAGNVVQVGTPQQIVGAPATELVRQFVAKTA